MVRQSTILLNEQSSANRIIALYILHIANYYKRFVHHQTL